MALHTTSLLLPVRANTGVAYPDFKDTLVDHNSHGSSNKRTHPKDPILVEGSTDYSRTKAPCRIDTAAFGKMTSVVAPQSQYDYVGAYRIGTKQALPDLNTACLFILGHHSAIQ